jgi:hypothetical protein
MPERTGQRWAGLLSGGPGMSKAAGACAAAGAAAPRFIQASYCNGGVAGTSPHEASTGQVARRCSRGDASQMLTAIECWCPTSPRETASSMRCETAGWRHSLFAARAFWTGHSSHTHAASPQPASDAGSAARRRARAQRCAHSSGRGLGSGQATRVRHEDGRRREVVQGWSLRLQTARTSIRAIDAATNPCLNNRPPPQRPFYSHLRTVVPSEMLPGTTVRTHPPAAARE